MIQWENSSQFHPALFGMAAGLPVEVEMEEEEAMHPDRIRDLVTIVQTIYNTQLDLAAVKYIIAMYLSWFSHPK